ncbi:YIP1 family protein [bacterium]|nr:YIP1 family protein [bacterium]
MDDTSVPQETTPEEMGRTAEAPPPVEPLSFSDKFIGVLTEPGATYENVRAAGPRTSDWVIPAIIMMIVIAAGTLARFANPDFLAQVQEAQYTALEERVESGEMSQEQYDQARQQMESMSGFYGPIGAVTGAIGWIILFFITALFYWLVTKFIMQGDIGYTAMLSVLGLVMFISILDQLISLLLLYLTGNPMAALNPLIFMDVNIADMGFGTKMLALLNPITIWATYVTGIGLEKVAMISRTKGMIAAFSLFIVFTALMMGFGMAGMG